MSNRLNNYIRDKIVENALVKAGLIEEQNKLAAERREWSEKVRLHMNGITDEGVIRLEKEAAAILERLPKQLRRSEEVRLVSRNDWDIVNLGGMRVTIYFEDDQGNRVSKIRASSDVPIAASHPLTKQFHKLEERERELKEKIAGLKGQVRAAVNSVTTVKKLLEVWPEALELIPAKAAPAANNLPAVVVADLNSMIGLPSERGEA